ncbi:MAG: cytochrome D1 domain-containing protein [Candidatus Magnetobacterium sp. LHC-1]|uniref:cytochrome D1 domain-containing protein n=1 Tax=Candidatus Magnetobacterium casense TaxID=1455061 RepID=UPI001C472320|nr:cytochrome D1 domain-containing protein [Candidatus Magnetobacterium casensis]
MREKTRKKGAAPPPFRTPCKGASPLDPIILYLITLFCSVLLFFSGNASAEKVFVVEREREALALIEDGKLLREISGVKNLNHATVKFHKGFLYVISRDGFLSKVDLGTYEVVKSVKTGKSGIGFIFCGGFIGVANYDPKDVVILDEALNTVKVIETGSRNVGIKCRDNLLIYALMDDDQIWMHDVSKNHEKVKEIKTKGEMPFDAFLSDNIYVTGFFKGGVGIVDLDTFKYTEKETKAGSDTVFKIPHFGTWGVLNQRAFIPAVGEKKLYILDMKDFGYISSIDLVGLPVFVVVSPDKKYIAVNYSGDKDDYVSVIDPQTNKVIKTISAGKRVMHLRFSHDSKSLYVSSYFENALKTFSVDTWDVTATVSVPTPSGVFIP